MNKSIIVLLDNGHGVNTPGKCSPDKTLLEYKWAREIVDKLMVEFAKLGIRSIKLVPEDTDISLRERVRRANQHYKNNNKQAILISVHCNAAGSDGKWHNACGWSVFVGKNTCRDTNCPAVLTENMFQDNKEDVALLLSEEGKKKIIDAHVQGVLNYLNG